MIVMKATMIVIEIGIGIKPEVKVIVKEIERRMIVVYMAT